MILLLWVFLFVLIVGAAWWLYIYRPDVFASWRDRFATLTQKEKPGSQQADQDASDLFVPRSEQIVPEIRPPVIGGQDVDDSPVEIAKEVQQSDARAASGTGGTNQPSPVTDSSQDGERFPAQSVDQPSVAASRANPARVPTTSSSPADPAPAPTAPNNAENATRATTESIPKRKHIHHNAEPRSAGVRKPKPLESTSEPFRPKTDAAIPGVAAKTNSDALIPHSGANADAPESGPDAPSTVTQKEDEPIGSTAADATAVSEPATPIRRKSGLVIIVNKANNRNLSKSDIRNIYRDRITRWPSGDQILVLDLPLESAERRKFSSAVLNMSPLDAATETSNAIITNRLQNEHRVKNSRVIVSYVERHKNAIGYVPAEALEADDDVRVAYTIP